MVRIDATARPAVPGLSVCRRPTTEAEATKEVSKIKDRRKMRTYEEQKSR